MPACAIIPYKYQQNANSAEPQFVILEDTRAGSYRNEMSDLTTLPLRCIESARGDARLFKALILAHEMTHFDIELPSAFQPERFVEIESYCDMMPMLAFQKTVDPAVFDVTFKEHILARSIAPVLVALSQNLEYPLQAINDSIYGHATALMMQYPELLEEENPGEIVIAANRRAVERIAAIIDRYSLEPYFMRAYRAAYDIVQHEPPSGDYSDHVIALFAEAIAYFSPSYAAKALANRQARNIAPSVDMA
ncbi:MAG: hypothetical protein ACK4VI_02965 [Alphaproteobacteria bacterium]